MKFRRALFERPLIAVHLLCRQAVLNFPLSNGLRERRGIIRTSALCPLCRHRHKGHWTGHKKRLDRDLHALPSRKSKDYAQEELVAELTAAFVCASLSITPTVRHADYLGIYLERLKDDKRAIFKAASAASKAADFLFAFEGTSDARSAPQAAALAS